MSTSLVISSLQKRGLSLRAWALLRGYNYRTVHVTVQRWADRIDRKPHGGLARQIMAQLSADLEFPTSDASGKLEFPTSSQSFPLKNIDRVHEVTYG